MTQHVPDDLLAAFVEADVDEAVAVHIAEHIDDCPACATRAATLEPLASAFARVPDPVPSPDLAARVVDEARRPEAVFGAEIAVGALLLAAAALLVALAGDPVGAAVELGVTAHALASLGEVLELGAVTSAPAVWISTLAATAACAIALRVASGRRSP